MNVGIQSRPKAVELSLKRPLIVPAKSLRRKKSIILGFQSAQASICGTRLSKLQEHGWGKRRKTSLSPQTLSLIEIDNRQTHFRRTDYDAPNAVSPRSAKDQRLKRYVRIP